VWVVGGWGGGYIAVHAARECFFAQGGDAERAGGVAGAAGDEVVAFEGVEVREDGRAGREAEVVADLLEGGGPSELQEEVVDRLEDVEVAFRHG
jgi:hypothetical protein